MCALTKPSLFRNDSMAKARFYIYVHRKADTGEVFYVGKGQGNRCNVRAGRSVYWKNIVEKHGFTVEKTAWFHDEQEAFAHEKFLIACMRNHGSIICNLTDGGEGNSGYVESPEAKKKRVDALRAALNDPEKSAKRSAALSAALKGKTFTAERIKNLSESHKGFKPTDATREKLRNRRFSREHMDAFMRATVDPELNEKRKAAISQTMKGYQKSEEHRAALSAAAKADWARRKALKQQTKSS